MLTLRPHHLICLLGFEGKGYSKPFVDNMQEIVDSLRRYPAQLVQIRGQYDTVCGPCPQRIDNLCQHQSIRKLDDAYQQLLQLDADTLLSWLEIKALIRQKVTMTHFERICADCRWQPYGACARALTTLLSSDGESSNTACPAEEGLKEL